MNQKKNTNSYKTIFLPNNCNYITKKGDRPLSPSIHL